MPNLPVKRMVLYKHGVGFFERLGAVTSHQVELTFKKEEMNDVLKSLAAFPQGEAQVVTISYETPEDKQSALAKAPIVLSQNSALLDLLRSLRGRHIRLHLTDVGASLPELQGVHTAEDEVAIAGILLGIDLASAVASGPATNSVLSGNRLSDNTLSDTIISLQTSGSEPDSHPILRTYTLNQVRGVDILDDQSGDDLRYVLELSRANADKRSVTILLNQPNQELLVSYIAPTPTWRVSYRLVYVPESPQASSNQTEPSEEATGQRGKILLQGWGIVDNQLDEDLDNVDLTLIAGQPISFVYDLYTPRLIDRPMVQDEERMVSGPVMFDEALGETLEEADAFGSTRRTLSAGAARERFDGVVAMSAPMSASRPSPSTKKRAMRRDMTTATEVKTEGTAKGEFFQYDVGNPVTIKRGQSAMVPILNATLAGEKAHIYNREKVPHHPVVTLTAKNTSGLTLERGPVTVSEDHNYVGEAVMAFTPAAGEFFVPYAVDLGVKVTAGQNIGTRTAAIRLGQGYLIHDRYRITTWTYTIENRTSDPVHLIIEHRIQSDATLWETPTPVAKTAEFYRWALVVPPRASQEFTSKERQLVSRNEKLKDWSDRTLRSFFDQKFIDQALFQRLQAILDLYQTLEKQRKEADRIRQMLEQRQEEQYQITEKLSNLGKGGEEGRLRQRFVSKISLLEDESDRLSQSLQSLEQTQQTVQTQIDQALRSLKQP